MICSKTQSISTIDAPVLVQVHPHRNPPSNSPMDVDNELFLLTLPYKHVEGRPVLVDIYLPHTLQPSLSPEKQLSALVYFHGGGLTIGNRRSWFPTWLKGTLVHPLNREGNLSCCAYADRLSAAGILFISADYRLLPPATGLDIKEDIEDLFRFLSNDVDPHLAQYCVSVGYPTVHLDSSRIAVAGTSAGGLCAYLAAVHADPKPVAVLGMYSMGGNFLVSRCSYRHVLQRSYMVQTPHYLSVKHEPFFRDRKSTRLNSSHSGESRMPSSA